MRIYVALDESTGLLMIQARPEGEGMHGDMSTTVAPGEAFEDIPYDDLLARSRENDGVVDIR